MQQVSKEYLSKIDVQEYTGASARTINYWMKAGLPHFRIGPKMLRFKRGDLDRWLERFRAEENEVDRVVGEVLGR